MKKDLKFDYLRHRPFLVIDFFTKPTVKTERPGWTATARLVEHPRVVQRISHHTMRTATVIIDLLNERVIKNRLRDNGTMFDDEVLKHYRARYAI
jgi:hypothetical protein